MEKPSPGNDVTALLLDWRHGDAAALERLVPLVYDELHRMARARLRRERPDHTLQSTALVHEAYLRLVRVDRMTLESRAHFLALAGRVMRQVLVDHARRKHADKRGAGITMVGLSEGEGIAVRPSTGVDILGLDRALDELGSFDRRQRDLVELKFFAGLTIHESAEVLGISPATVEREWASAKAWLFGRLTGS